MCPCLLDYLPIYQYAIQGKPKRQGSSFIKKHGVRLSAMFRYFSVIILFFLHYFSMGSETLTWHLKWQWYACLGSNWNWNKSCTIPLVSLLFYMAKEVQIVQWHFWQDLFIWCYSLSCLGISLFIAIAITHIVKALRLSKYEFF